MLYLRQPADIGQLLSATGQHRPQNTPCRIYYYDIFIPDFRIGETNNTNCSIIFQSSEYVVTSVRFNNITPPGWVVSLPQIRGKNDSVSERPQDNIKNKHMCMCAGVSHLGVFYSFRLWVLSAYCSHFGYRIPARLHCFYLKSFA